MGNSTNMHFNSFKAFSWMLIEYNYTLFLILNSILFSKVVCQTQQLSLDGTTMKGSVTFNSYNYYYFISDDSSGNVDIITTVDSGSPYGVGTYVGRGYKPYDGDSDWDGLAITGYNSDITVDNIQINATYYVSVQGIGDSDTYSIKASLTQGSYIKPTQLIMNDMPYDSKCQSDQYSDFLLNISTNGNFSCSVYVESSDNDIKDGIRNVGDIDTQLLVSPDGVLPRDGNYQWMLEISKSGDWESLQIPFARRGQYGISVSSQYDTQFYIKCFNTTSV